jgi:alkanesulfonate monooxygenase SsuD/methylene tetrahydromethanopterin reductase-like flavin-dependent oxidoreductase (luciferase family)
LNCWTAEEPFDWNGKYWQGKNIVATPRPLNAPHMPIATATDTEAMIELARLSRARGRPLGRDTRANVVAWIA